MVQPIKLTMSVVQNILPNISLGQWLLYLLCLSMLNACGFKLRGEYNLPVAMQETYIEAAQDKPDLVRALKLSLKASDVRVLPTATAEAAILKLFNERKTKRIVSVDSRGRAREYTLTYSISFKLLAAQANFEIDEQNISIERDFLFDPEDVLGNSRGESQLYEEMQQDLVRLILLRLQSKS